MSLERHDAIGFRASPLDRQRINTIRTHFHEKRKVFADQSTAIRFAIQETAHLIAQGHSFERNKDA